MNLRRGFRSQQPDSDKYPQHFPSLHLTLCPQTGVSLFLHLSQPIQVMTDPEKVHLGLSLLTLRTELRHLSISPCSLSLLSLSSPHTHNPFYPQKPKSSFIKERNCILSSGSSLASCALAMLSTSFLS